MVDEALLEWFEKQAADDAASDEFHDELAARIGGDSSLLSPSDAEANAKESETKGQPSLQDFMDNIRQQILRELKAQGDALGYTTEALENWFEGQVPALYAHLADFVSRQMLRSTTPYPSSIQDFNDLEDMARRWLGARDGSGTLSGLLGTSSSGGGGGSGRISTKPTKEQLRKQFDVDQLSRAVTNTYRGLLFTDTKNSRAIAEAYVEAYVADPEQKLDFDTFVRNRIRQEPRYNLLYKHKPKGMTEEQYFQPYVNSAQQMLAPREIEQAVTGAAQLGASQAQFRARMARSDSQTASAPFINSFGQRISDLKGIFKG